MKDLDKKKELVLFKRLDPRDPSDLAYWESKNLFSLFSAGTPISLNLNGDERIYRIPSGVAELMREIEQWLYTDKHNDNSIEDFVKALENIRRKHFTLGESLFRAADTQSLYNTPIRISISKSDITIISEIGTEDKGAFGKVFKAKYKNNTEVAIKKTIPASSAKREFEMAGQFDSPFIVYCYGAYSLGSELRIVFELMPQGSLEHHLHRTNNFNYWSPIKELWAFDIISAIDYLHQLGIVHKDLKAANILLDSEWHLKLADFGNSKPTSKKCTPSGTPKYVAPEILPILPLRGNTVSIYPTFSSDMFSYAALLAELISPVKFLEMTDTSCFALFSLELKKELVAPCPQDFLKNIARDCWAQNPEQRPTANNVIKTLSQHMPTVPPIRPPKSAPRLGS